MERGWILPFLGLPSEPVHGSAADPAGEFDVTDAVVATDLARRRTETDAIRAALRGHDLDELEVTGRSACAGSSPI